MKVLYLLFLAPTVALAAAPSLHLEASAKAQVPNDEMVVVFAVEQSGQDVGKLNDQVLGALNKAIATAKAVPEMNVRLGGIRTNPNWQNGKTDGWNVHGEVEIDSKNIPALSTLSGRMSKELQIASVSFRLSEAKRKTVEDSLTRDAATNFRQKAANAAKAFGFAAYDLKEISLGQNASFPQPYALKSMAAQRAQPMPSEGGDSEVIVTVSGTVELK